MSTSVLTTRPAAVAAYSMKKSYQDKTVLDGVDLTIASCRPVSLARPGRLSKQTPEQRKLP